MTDAQVEAACATLKRAIEAAENSNQAGEDFVMAAAAGPDLLAACKAAWTTHSLAEDEPGLPGLLEVAGMLKAAITKATGREP